MLLLTKGKGLEVDACQAKEGMILFHAEVIGKMPIK